jgi:hypothetical protein
MSVVCSLSGAHGARRAGRTCIFGLRGLCVSVVEGALFGFAVDGSAVGLARQGGG